VEGKQTNSGDDSQVIVGTDRTRGAVTHDARHCGSHRVVESRVGKIEASKRQVKGKGRKGPVSGGSRAGGRGGEVTAASGERKKQVTSTRKKKFLRDHGGLIALRTSYRSEDETKRRKTRKNHP